MNRLLVLILLLFMLVINSSCTDHNSALLKQQSLIFCADGAPDNFNPNTGTSSTNFNASSRVLFNRLLTIDNDSGEIRPSLASEWRKSDDGLRYYFQLRDDVHFHTTEWFTPDRTLNAEDVIFSFNRQADKQHPFHLAQSGSYNYFQSTGLQNNLVSIESLGEHEVVFQLSHPDESFLYSMSMDFASIVSAQYAESLQLSNRPLAQFDRLPVGTGPFKLNKYQDNSFVRYYAHPQYFEGRPAIEHLIYAITPDVSTRYARLISGECDVLLNPPKSQFDLLLENDELQVLRNPGLNTGFMVFNILKPPLDDIRVRQAISMAINKERLVEKVYGLLGVMNHSLLPPSMMPYHNADIRTPDYDPSSARKILAELNLGAINLDLWALPVQRSYNPNGTLMAELIQEDLERVGIRTRIVSYDWSTYLDKVKAGEHDMALLGWVADNYHPNDFLSALISCSGIIAKTNRTNWCNSVLDGLLKNAEDSQDVDEKVQLYYEIQAMIAQQLPLLPIATGESILIARKSVKNLEIQALGGVSFTSVSKEAP